MWYDNEKIKEEVNDMFRKTVFGVLAVAAAAAAVLRGLSLEAVAAQSSRNACAAFPRLASLLSRPDAFCCQARDKLRNVVQHSVDDPASSEV